MKFVFRSPPGSFSRSDLAGSMCKVKLLFASLLVLCVSCEALLGADFKDVHKGVADAGAESAAINDSSPSDFPDSGDAPGGDSSEASDEDATDAPDRGARDDAAPDASPDLSVLPSEVAGLVLWLEASHGVEFADPSQKVAVWRDQSSAHNDAFQANIEFMPRWAPDVINGLPALQFSGPVTFLTIPDDSSLRWGTRDFVILAVIRYRVVPVWNGMIYQKVKLVAPWEGASLYLSSDAARPTAQIATGSVSVGMPLSPITPYIVSTRRAGATLQVRVNGVVQNSVTKSSIAAADCSSDSPAQIGHNGYVPNPYHQYFDGNMAEVIGIAGALSDATLGGVENYLRAKYGLSASMP